MPGLRQNRAEWMRALHLLKTAPVSAAPDLVRSAVLADMDALALLLPSLATLTAKERWDLIKESSVLVTEPGTTILRHGEGGDEAYFILSGRAVAGIADESGNYRSLSSMTAGDFFGEIAALTGAARTADVVAETDITLLRVPSKALRTLMSHQALSTIFLAKMSERLVRTSIKETPRFIGIDQKDALELRTVPAAD